LEVDQPAIIASKRRPERIAAIEAAEYDAVVADVRESICSGESRPQPETLVELVYCVGELTAVLVRRRHYRGLAPRRVRIRIDYASGNVATQVLTEVVLGSKRAN